MHTLYRAGLLVLGVISVGDLALPLYTDGETPPLVIALIGSAFGLVSLILIGLAWSGRLGAAVGLVVVRALSALSAVPAFLVEGVPTSAKVLAGVGIALTVLGSVLLFAGMRRPASSTLTSSSASTFAS